MSRRKPRPSECLTARDFVRAGILVPVQPSASSGYTAYGTGREFLPVGDSPVSVLAFLQTQNGASLVGSTGTVAARCVPKFAADDGVVHWIVYGRNAAADNYNFYLSKHSDTTWRAGIRGADFAILATGAVSFAAGTTHQLVARWAATTLDLNADGTDVAQAAHERTVAVGSWVGLGCENVTPTAANAFVGPVIISPTRKSDGWTTAIQASSGAAYSSTARLVRDFMAVGDFICPLVSDSTAYVRVK